MKISALACMAVMSWAAATLQIAQNSALFSLLGATYRGDGRTTFALPNIAPLQGAAAPAPAPTLPGGEARIYQPCELGGWSVPLGLGGHHAVDLARPPYSDNGLSAVRASSGWTVTLFDGPNLDGQSVTVTGEDRCLVKRGFNDMTSSIRVRRAAPPRRREAGRKLDRDAGYLPKPVTDRARPELDRPSVSLRGAPSQRR